MPLLIIIAVGFGAAQARADNLVYSYCWARANDSSNVTHEFVTDVVQILNSRQDQFKASVSREIDGSRFAQLDARANPSATPMSRSPRAIQVDVSKCAEYNPEGDGGVASIRNLCKEKIWVTYCYSHPLPDTAASRIDCGKGSFGGAGPLTEGGSDTVPPGTGAIAVMFSCPYPATRLDLGEGVGKWVGVTPESRYRCASVPPRTIGRAR
jgi:hypothetical protein